MEFWAEFEDTFGTVGRDPVGMYTYEVGHILSVTPEEMGELTPSAMLGAMWLFNHLYRAGNA